jgi:hypothetical protein
LDHADEARRKVDVRDIVMSEIAIPMRINCLGPSYPARQSLLKAPGIVSGNAFALPLAYYGTLRSNELPLLDDIAMQDALGVDVKDFERFQRALPAVALAW